MSSILTNTSAMVALQTLKGINSSLAKTQDEISTGKSVASAKDNSAIWAISKVMEADMSGFSAISDSLSLGQSTVSVARQATETVSGLLENIKGKIVAAQQSTVDREKLQTDIGNLRDQVTSVVNAAQLSGVNLLKGTDATQFLSSLDRTAGGGVVASSITVNRQDLTMDAGVYGTGASLAANATASAATVGPTANTATLTIGGTVAAGNQFNFQVAGKTVSFTAATTATDDVAAGLTAALNAAGIEGVTASVAASVITVSSTSAFKDVALTTSNTGAGTMALSATEIEARAETVTFSATAPVSEGDGYRVTVGGVNFDYIAGRGESFEDVAKGLKAVIDGAAMEGISTNVTKNDSGQVMLQVDSEDAFGFAVSGAAGGEATGGLQALAGIDVTTGAGAKAALGNIETLIQIAVDAAAEFGSAESRIEVQNTFIGKLTDAMKAGIGSLVDADMEEASARLQALQVQQQLGIQSLSIANQAPQNILALFK